MQPFTYHRPGSVSAAKSFLASNPGAVLLGGGMTVIPGLKQGAVKASCLVSLDGVPELDGIHDKAGHISIGAGVKHAAIATSEVVRQKLPVLARLAGGIGDPGVRHQGTLGGALAMGKLSTELSIAAIALDAVIDTDLRQIRAADFCGEGGTATLAPDEIILDVHFRVPVSAGYRKFRHPESRYPQAVAFAAIFPDSVRVATGQGVDGRWSLIARSVSYDIDNLAMMAGQSGNPGERGSYEDQLVFVAMKRAIEEARG